MLGSKAAKQKEVNESRSSKQIGDGLRQGIARKETNRKSRSTCSKETSHFNPTLPTTAYFENTCTCSWSKPRHSPLSQNCKKKRNLSYREARRPGGKMLANVFSKCGFSVFLKALNQFDLLSFFCTESTLPLRTCRRTPGAGRLRWAHSGRTPAGSGCKRGKLLAQSGLHGRTPGSLLAHSGRTPACMGALRTRSGCPSATSGRTPACVGALRTRSRRLRRGSVNSGGRAQGCPDWHLTDKVPEAHMAPETKDWNMQKLTGKAPRR